MKKELTTLLVALLTTTSAVLEGCQHLPADFPLPPDINLCAPVLTGKKGDANRMIAYWRCQNTGSDKIRTEPANYVHVGVPVEDWNRGQAYRTKVENYFMNHSCQ